MMNVANKWTVTAGADGSELSLPGSDCVSKSRIRPYDPATLPFDPRSHTSVEISPSDQLYSIVMGHLVKEGTVCDEDAVSFQMSRAEKGGKSRSGCCGGPGNSNGSSGDDSTEALKSIAVSLGLGLFRFHHKDSEIKALHQHVGDPVGTGCGAQVLSSLILFTEGTGHAAMRIIQSFLAEVLANSERTAKNTFQVYRWHIKFQYWQRVGRVAARPVSSVVLPENVADKLVEDVSEFLSEETACFYQEHGIPYKRSYLFHGVPGAGKTSMIQALAGKFGRNLCYLSPTHPELSDDSLKSAIERVPDNAIIVLEDVDALFGKNREKKIQQSPLTFSGLLNALDGVGNHDGLIFVLTTNFKDQLDTALIRDGRVDMRIRFDYCTPYQMEKLFENFYPEVQNQDVSIKDTQFDADPEIALLEAKLLALKQAKVLGGSTDNQKCAVSNAVAFRDALLASLGERNVSTAQLQHFFVTHRKCTAAEAIADVSAIAASIDERQKDEEKQAKDATQAAAEGQNPTPQNGGKPSTKNESGQSDGKSIHVHVHTDK